LKKTKYPANAAPDQVKQYPYYCLIVVSLSFLTGRRLKVFLNESWGTWAEGSKYFNKSSGIWAESSKIFQQILGHLELWQHLLYEKKKNGQGFLFCRIEYSFQKICFGACPGGWGQIAESF
jgi:hypothetical protein